ncbi:MAG: hypothetical protein K8T90_19720 [Planctomycetes bacterium]|nr:hypothetical protein [Planctomycetota bacterium]
MHALRIVVLCVAAAVVFGIVHDMFTAHVCVEYFTIGHPRVIDSESPILLALVWGVIATWWVGLPLGVLLAAAARIGSRPTLGARELVRPIVALLGVMAACSLLAGVVGYVLAANGGVWLVGSLAERVPKDRHQVFLADLWAHNASYLAGALGGVVLAARTWIVRGRSTPSG